MELKNGHSFDRTLRNLLSFVILRDTLLGTCRSYVCNHVSRTRYITDLNGMLVEACANLFTYVKNCIQ